MRDFNLIIELTRDRRWNTFFCLGSVLCLALKLLSSCLTWHGKSLLLSICHTTILARGRGWPWSCRAGYGIWIKRIKARFLYVDNWLFLSTTCHIWRCWLSVLVWLSQWFYSRANIELSHRPANLSEHRGMLTMISTDEWRLRPWRWWEATSLILLRANASTVFPASRLREFLHIYTCRWLL